MRMDLPQVVPSVERLIRQKQEERLRLQVRAEHPSGWLARNANSTSVRLHKRRPKGS